VNRSEEFNKFSTLVDKVLSVSREEIVQREAEYRRQSDLNPRKRGPKKRVVKPSASRDLGAER
jgi:hypothetical protein